MGIEIIENSYIVLRFMVEHGFTTSNKVIDTADLAKLVRVDIDKFESIDGYLQDMGFIKKVVVFKSTARYATAKGMMYLHQEIGQRLPLDLDAERLLRYMMDVEPSGGYHDVEGVDGDQAEAVLDLNREQWLRAITQLEDNGLITSTVNEKSVLDWDTVKLTPEGRNLIRRRFKDITDTAASIELPSGDEMIVKPIWRGRNFQLNEKLCFVAMPFSEEWSNRIWSHLKNIIESLGFEAKRGDDFVGPIVTEDIWEGLNIAGTILVDITGRNPNVFYELGIAYTLGKKVILITQDIADIPFDIYHHRVIEYKDNSDEYTVLENQLPKFLADSQ